MVNHPNDNLFTEWVTTVPTSTASLQAKLNKVTLNYKSVYDALNRPRKRPLTYKSVPGPPEDSNDYIQSICIRP